MQLSSYIFPFFFIQIEETWQILDVLKCIFTCWMQDLSKPQLFSQKSFNIEHTLERKRKKERIWKTWQIPGQYFSYSNLYITMLCLHILHSRIFWNKNSRNSENKAILRNGYEINYYQFMMLSSPQHLKDFCISISNTINTYWAWHVQFLISLKSQSPVHRCFEGFCMYKWRALIIICALQLILFSG